MSISDLYSSGFKERNRDHFASIVRVALSDDKITDEERKFIDRLSINLDIDPKMKADILKDPKKYPINPPYDKRRRLERLYDLARIVYADSVIDEAKRNIMRRIVIGLGFNTKNVDDVIEKSLRLVKQKILLEDFVKAFN